MDVEDATDQEVPTCSEGSAAQKEMSEGDHLVSLQDEPCPENAPLWEKYLDLEMAAAVPEVSTEGDVDPAEPQQKASFFHLQAKISQTDSQQSRSSTSDEEILTVFDPAEDGSREQTQSGGSSPAALEEVATEALSSDWSTLALKSFPVCYSSNEKDPKSCSDESNTVVSEVELACGDGGGADENADAEEESDSRVPTRISRSSQTDPEVRNCSDDEISAALWYSMEMALKNVDTETRRSCLKAALAAIKFRVEEDLSPEVTRRPWPRPQRSFSPPKFAHTRTPNYFRGTESSRLKQTTPLDATSWSKPAIGHGLPRLNTPTKKKPRVYKVSPPHMPDTNNLKIVAKPAPTTEVRSIRGGRKKVDPAVVATPEPRKVSTTMVVLSPAGSGSSRKPAVGRRAL